MVSPCHSFYCFFFFFFVRVFLLLIVILFFEKLLQDKERYTLAGIDRMQNTSGAGNHA